MNILLYGAPGSGKGTQSAYLVERFSMVHISTGDLFRVAIKNKTPLGVEAKGYMDQGKLVPDSVTVGMVKEALIKKEKKPFVLDGFPRNIPQAEALGVLLGELNLFLDKVISLEVPQPELVERLSGRRVCRGCGAVYHIVFKPLRSGNVCDVCGSADIYQRDDDKASAVETRLKVYEQSTSPLKAYYGKKNKLVEVIGTGKAEVVFGRIERLLKKQQ